MHLVVYVTVSNTYYLIKTVVGKMNVLRWRQVTINKKIQNHYTGTLFLEYSKQVKIKEY
jgi:hypothetical protein